MKINPYKVMSDQIETLTEHVESEILADQKLELAQDNGFESYKDYEEAQE